jgi:hypothetical protein
MMHKVGGSVPVHPNTYHRAAFVTLLLLATWAAATPAQQPDTNGPTIGSIVPSFEAPDQNGHVQNLKSIAGSKGALLVFFKSADY